MMKPPVSVHAFTGLFRTGQTWRSDTHGLDGETVPVRLDVRDRFLGRLPVRGHDVGDDDGRGKGDTGYSEGENYCIIFQLTNPCTLLANAEADDENDQGERCTRRQETVD
jgi:hypothetical protein